MVYVSFLMADYLFNQSKQDLSASVRTAHACFFFRNSSGETLHMFPKLAGWSTVKLVAVFYTAIFTINRRSCNYYSRLWAVMSKYSLK